MTVKITIADLRAAERFFRRVGAAADAVGDAADAMRGIDPAPVKIPSAWSAWSFASLLDMLFGRR